MGPKLDRVGNQGQSPCSDLLQKTIEMKSDFTRTKYALAWSINRSNYKDAKISLGLEVPMPDIPIPLGANFDAYDKSRSDYFEQRKIEMDEAKALSYYKEYLDPKLGELFVECLRITNRAAYNRLTVYKIENIQVKPDKIFFDLTPDWGAIEHPTHNIEIELTFYTSINSSLERQGKSSILKYNVTNLNCTTIAIPTPKEIDLKKTIEILIQILRDDKKALGTYNHVKDRETPKVSNINIFRLNDVSCSLFIATCDQGEKFNRNFSPLFDGNLNSFYNSGVPLYSGQKLGWEFTLPSTCTIDDIEIFFTPGVLSHWDINIEFIDENHSVSTKFQKTYMTEADGVIRLGLPKIIGKSIERIQSIRIAFTFAVIDAGNNLNIREIKVWGKQEGRMKTI